MSNADVASASPDLPAPGLRAAALASALRTVRERIAAAESAAGRAAGEVTLIVVTKDSPASDVRLVVELGVTAVGESREQQLRAKSLALPDLSVQWHFIGRLQRNKAVAVARLAAVVHSVDDERLLVPLSRGAVDAGRVCGCLVQVNLDEAAGRGGVAPDRALRLADAVAATPGLALLGIMAVAPPSAPPEPAFERLAATAASIRRAHPSASWISAGMSGDLAAAIIYGATHVRVGTAVLGPRPLTR